MKSISKSEYSNLRFIAVLEIFLFLFACIFIAIALVAYVERKFFPPHTLKAFSVSLIIGATYSTIIAILCIVSLLIQGADMIRKVMRMQSFALFIYSVLALYLSGCAVYLSINLSAGSRPIMIATAVLAAVSAVYVIFVTMKMPYMLTVLSDIKKYPKGEQIRLYRFAFGQGSPQRLRRSDKRVLGLKAATSDDERKPIMQGP